jgi:hypothetical protein
MGLLDRVWNAVDPFLPDEQIMGLLGRGQPAAPQPAPMPPVQRSGPINAQLDAIVAAGGRQPPQRQGPGLERYIEGFIGGRLPGQVRDDFAVNQTKAGLQRLIAQTVTDPRERAVALTNPMEWAKANAGRYGYHGVNGGDQAIFGDPTAGGTIHTAPKYGMDNGRGYSVGPDGISPLGELDPSYSDQTARMNAEANANGFTLSPGAIRYGKDNQPVASAPFAPRLEQVDPTKDLYQMGGPQKAPQISAPQALAEMFPRATVTSGARTPEHNAAVGGVPNSYHLKGQAVDLKPPAGMTTGQFAAAIKASGIPLEEVIDEGNHVHVAWADGAQAPAGPELLRKGNPEAKTKDAPSGYRYKADGALEPIPGGPADPAVSSNTKNLKPVPTGAKAGYVGNSQALKNIDRAIKAATDNPEAFGVENYMPLQIRDRLPGKGSNGGVSARAIVAQISSQKIHDLSGAAVTATEFPRLRPFIPLATDRADVVIQKLENMRLEYQSILEQTEAAYGPDSGYRPINSSDAPAAPPQKRLSPQEAAKLPKGTRFTGQDGIERVRQ